VTMGLRDGSNGIVLGAGVNKASVANNFCAFNGYAYVDLGVPFDTAYHIFEGWGTGANTWKGRFDGGNPVSYINVNPQIGAMYKFLISNNGATAADQSAIVDWAAVAGVPL